MSLRNCYLSNKMIENLAAVLQDNQTLIKLDLSANGLLCSQGSQIIRALKVMVNYNIEQYNFGIS